MNGWAGILDKAAGDTLRGRVYAELCELLMAGQMAPGERLSLRLLAERMGVSPMPVRDAISRLVAEDALEVLPQRAARVPVMTRARFLEIKRIRLALEGMAVAEAALRATPEDVDRIEAHRAAFADEAAAGSPDLPAVVRHNKNLHFAAYSAAAMPVLLRQIARLWLQVGPVINLDLRADARRLRETEAHHHHAGLVAAMRAHDPEAARAALEGDIETAAASILAQGKLPD